MIISKSSTATAEKSAMSMSAAMSDNGGTSAKPRMPAPAAIATSVKIVVE
jgi:hypothetical protein